MNMNRELSLSVIIVSYASREFIEPCLRSICAEIRVDSTEIIVVDNDSDDNTIETVNSIFPDVKIIANSANVGYSKAINQGVKASSGQYILILNADTIIKTGTIQALLAFMEKNPDTGVAGPKLLYPDGRLQYSCRTFQTFKTILLRRTFLSKIFPKSKTLRDHLMLGWDHSSQKEVDWLVGAFLMVRRKAFEQIGLMDERYFLYFEDVDLCYRMKTAGWKVFYVPQAEAIHHYKRGSYSESVFSRDVFVHIVSLLRYYDKWNKLIYIMKKLSNFFRVPMLCTLDFLGIMFSFWITFKLRESIGMTESKPLYPIFIYYNPLLFFSVSAIAIYFVKGLYRNDRGVHWVDRLFVIVKSMLIACLIMALFLLLSKGYEVGFLYSRFVLISFVIVSISVSFLTRQTIYLTRRWFWKRRLNLKRILIVGQDQTALDIKSLLSKSPELGYDIVSIISPVNDQTALTNPKSEPAIDKLVDTCEKERVREVIFLNITKYYKNVIHQAIKCRRKLIDVKMVTDDFEAETLDKRVRDFVGFPSVDLGFGALHYLGFALKRLMDLGISLAGLVVFSPIIILISLRLKLEGDGIIFVQKRIGRDEKEFDMYKFRTMIPGAENQKEHLENVAMGGALFKAINDPRVTRFGRFLRKYNLDEIPQFINVLKGELSLIGPRPPIAEEVAQYDDWHKARLEVKPGITGLWQVDKERKWRFDEMVRLDIFYIVNWSPLLDFRILLRTPGAILRGTGFHG